jgi:hypothetical protein
MTQQFVPQTQFQQFQVQPVTAPAQPQFQNRQPAPMVDQKPKGPNIWYRPVTQADYPKISEMGSATIAIRILPGFNNNGCYESIFEKNNSGSMYPNSKQWILPVLVLSDSLHPDKNGFVGVMTVSKTLYNRIKSRNTPANYFDFNNGFNFLINVSLAQSKDGQQWFPNYNKSAFETAPSACPVDYVAPKMNEGKFADFAQFANMINTPKPKNAPPQNMAMGNPALAPRVNYAQPTQQFNGYAPQAAPQYNVPQAAPQYNVPQAAPVQTPPISGGDDEFEQIFNGN